MFVGSYSPAEPGHEPMREHLLGLGHARLGELRRLVLLVDEVVAGRLELLAVLRLDVALRHGAGRELRNDAVDLVVEVGGFLRRTGDDQRRPRFVDEDAVDLVHDGEAVPALDELREVELHVVAQVVEAELVVRAVGDVAAVGDLPLGVVQLVLDHADRHAEEAVDLAHPLGVAAGEVVVDRDDVHALAFERVEVGGQRGDERLAFAGLHFRDPAAVQHHAADELHVEVAHVEHAPAGFAHDGEGLRQHVVERSRPGRPARGTRPSARASRASESPVTPDSSSLMRATIGRSRFSSRSFCVPMTLARSVLIMPLSQEARLPANPTAGPSRPGGDSINQ